MQVSIYAPCAGTLMPLNQVKDDAFAQKMLGEGVAIKPAGSLILAPCDGVVQAVGDAHHAVVIDSTDGVTVLVHVGIDTCSLQGQGFEAFVSAGQSISKGQALIRFDGEKLRGHGLSDVVMMCVLNTDTCQAIQTQDEGICDNDDCVMAISL